MLQVDKVSERLLKVDKFWENLLKNWKGSESKLANKNSNRAKNTVKGKKIEEIEEGVGVFVAPNDCFAAVQKHVLKSWPAYKSNW